MSRRSTGAGMIGRTVTVLAMIFGAQAEAQQVYDNNETIVDVKYVTRPEGRVAQAIDNPAPDAVNSSVKCAKFTRNRQRYDYIKVLPSQRLDNVQAYASYDDAAPRFRMKVYTTAPAGSVVELQLGKQNANAYPEGTHSQYQAVTTKTGVWEELEFKYVVTPKGSETSARQVDQVTLLFMPNTTATFAFYFDELTGPGLQTPAAAKFFKRRQSGEKQN